MDAQRRTGVILVVLGAIFLLARFGWGGFAWPLFVIVPGVVLLLLALVGPRSSSGLAVPGAIVTTVGLILAVMDATGTYHAWSYAWGLVLAAVGVGSFLQSSIEHDVPGQREGLKQAGLGLALFAGFGVFFELLIFGGGFRGTAGWLLPAILILAGAWMLWRDRRAH